MKIKTLKSLKAERKHWTNKLSDVESKEAKEYIDEQIEILDIKIEGKIMTRQWLIDMGTYAAGSVIGTIIVNKWKK
ncbi:hypothetical protein LaP1706_gp25 [Lactococcus phage 1706]|uniref:Uncharacterized protein n=1 Tax=Lactococcus phage 1706 TaxID=475178 RepID=B2BTI9_9CAUD|nr:hypothetical protein LaP1706_gp25 [Lactococcus phage 1706]ABV91232.1 unknown [Lactococcus phage 1706]